MRQAEIAAITHQVAQLVTEHYVFPGLGADVGQLLEGRLAAGRYAAAADEGSLATLLTDDLQSVNGDQHLRLMHHPTEVPETGDETAQLASMAAYAERTSGGIARAERLDGNVGYLDLRPVLFPPSVAGDAAVAAMTLVAPTDALIIDLRRCLGGSPDMVALLCSYLFGHERVHLIDMYERAGGLSRQSWTQPYTPGRRFGADKPVFVLTSGTTFSGGEELSYDLQQLGRARIVGERTRGGAHPREGFRVRPHLEATIPVARAVSPVSGTNWEGTGVLPDIAVPAGEALQAAYQRALAHVLTLGEDGARAETAREARRALDGIAERVPG